MAGLVDKALEVAVSQNGVRERGENTGKEVDAYLRSAGCGPGNPWCAAFVYWSIEKAADSENVDNPFIRTAYCPDIATWGKQHDIFGPAPERGDVFLRYGTVAGEFRASHTGLVTGIHGNSFDTVEGNTNDGGSREGIGVFLRTRPISETYKFVRWGKLAPDTAKVTYALVLSGGTVCQMPVISGRSLCPVRTWGKAIGLDVGWDDNEHMPTLGGQILHADVSVIDNTSYAPISQLVANAGLKMTVDVPSHTATVTRP